MVNEDARRQTVLAYFIFLGIGVAFSMAGVVTKAIADAFAVDTAVVGYIFTFFTAGYSIAIAGNGFFLERVSTRRLTVAAGFLAALGAAGATLWPELRGLAASLFLYGLGLGALCSIAYYLMVSLYEEAARAAKLNVLNFFYCVGAIGAPFFAGLALKAGANWQSVYQATLVLTLTVVWWAARSRFSQRPRPAAAAAEGRAAWGAEVYVVGAAMLAYVMAEIVFTYWVVTYMMEALQADVVLASLSLSLFWGAMAAGRLAAGGFLERVGLRRYLLASAGLALTAFLGLLAARQAVYAVAMVAVIGLGCSGLYATILAYGTSLSAAPSAALTSFFLGLSAAGGIAAFLLSSWLKAHFAVASAIILAAALMGAVILLTAVAVKERA